MKIETFEPLLFGYISAQHNKIPHDPMVSDIFEILDGFESTASLVISSKEECKFFAMRFAMLQSYVAGASENHEFISLDQAIVDGRLMSGQAVSPALIYAAGNTECSITVNLEFPESLLLSRARKYAEMYEVRKSHIVAANENATGHPLHLSPVLASAMTQLDIYACLTDAERREYIKQYRKVLSESNPDFFRGFEKHFNELSAIIMSEKMQDEEAIDFVRGIIHINANYFDIEAIT